MEEAKLIRPAARPAQPVIPLGDLPLSEADLRLTEDDLPCSDGMPMETERHVLQMMLLIETLRAYWAGRDDVFVGGNMFVYFSPQQTLTHDFRGPDVFVAQGVKKRERKSWVSWQEGKPPDVVIELISESTASFDKNEKKQIYQDRLQAPEYFWYDPFSGELAGFALREGRYQQLAPDAEGRLVSQRLGLSLTPWNGKYQGVEAQWLRWATLDGQALPTREEIAEQERKRAKQERKRAEQERERAKQEHERAEQEHERAEQERERVERLAAKLRELGVDPDTLK